MQVHKWVNEQMNESINLKKYHCCQEWTWNDSMMDLGWRSFEIGLGLKWRASRFIFASGLAFASGKKSFLKGVFLSV